MGVPIGLIVVVNYSEEVGNIIRGEITNLSPQIAKGISSAIISTGIALAGGLVLWLIFHGMSKYSFSGQGDRLGRRAHSRTARRNSSM